MVNLSNIKAFANRAYDRAIAAVAVVLRRICEWVNRKARSTFHPFFDTEMLLSAHEIRDYILRAPSMSLNQDKVEVRMLSAFVAGVFLLLSIEPLFYIFMVPDSLLAKISNMAWSKWLLMTIFWLSFCCTLPHLFTLTFRPDLLADLLADKVYRTAASAGAIGSAIAWLMLANLVIPLDVGALEWAYGIRGLICVLISIIFASSVNAQQMREKLHAASV